MICAGCRKPIDDQITHCPYCGQAQAQPSDNKKTMFGYAPSPNELAQQMAQQNQAAHNQPPHDQMSQNQGGQQPQEPLNKNPNDAAFARTMYAVDTTSPNGDQLGMPSPFSASQTDPNAQAANVPPTQFAPPAQSSPDLSQAPQQPANYFVPNQQQPPQAQQQQPGQFQQQPGQFQQQPGQFQQQPGQFQQQPGQFQQQPGQFQQQPYQQQGYPQQQPAQNTGMMTWFWALMILGNLLLGGILTGAGMADRAIMELLFFSWIPLLVATIFYPIFLYKIWAVLQDGVTKPSAGAAVGFMFIPFFNLYWIFIAIGSYGKRYNEFAARHQINAQAPEGLFLTCAILMFIPFGSIISLFILIFAGCGAVNRLARASSH